ncbi:unnamed protein product, partial [marine sediment metagenome]
MPVEPLNTHRWRKLRKAILNRDDHTCAWCGGVATEADHVIARAEGGDPFDPSNIVASCRGCNATRGGYTKARRRTAVARTGTGREYWPRTPGSDFKRQSTT